MYPGDIGFGRRTGYPARRTFMRILLVGDPEQVLLHRGGLDQLDAASDLDQARGLLAGGSYDLIALQMPFFEPHLAPAIRQLRQAGARRIVLLARIYQEPIVSRYTDPVDPDKADEYLIYPLSIEALTGQQVGPVDSDRSVIEQTESYIRTLEQLATEDELTGLKNRRYVWEFTRQLIELSATDQVRMTLVIFDIDGFKHYNDTYGHATGDRILKEIAVLIKGCCRPHDVVARLGGDEFAVIVWDCPDIPSGGRQPDRRTGGSSHPAEVLSIAQRFTAALGRSGWSTIGPQGKGTLTVSGGLASFPEDGRTVEQLFRKADAALMEAKRSGKDRIVVVGQLQD